MASAIVLLGWGVMALGASRPWGYAPLLAGMGALGAATFLTCPDSGLISRGLCLSLASVCAAIACQLIPLPTNVLSVISPATAPLVGRGAAAAHPLSISPDATAPDDLTAWQVRAFNEWFEPLAARGVTRNGGVQNFQLAITLTKLLSSTSGDVPTAATMAARTKAFTGPVWMGVPRLAYGAIPGLPAVGSLSSRVYVYLGNGSWGDTTGGKWLEPPALPQGGRR